MKLVLGLAGRDGTVGQARCQLENEKWVSELSWLEQCQRLRFQDLLTEPLLYDLGKVPFCLWAPIVSTRK